MIRISPVIFPVSSKSLTGIMVHPDRSADGPGTKTINNLTGFCARGYWILDAGYWMLDTGCWILDAGYVLKKGRVDEFPELFFVLVADGNVDRVIEDDAVPLDHGDLRQVDDVLPVNPHKLSCRTLIRSVVRICRILKAMMVTKLVLWPRLVGSLSRRYWNPL
jgi:hypothetical protein